MAPPNAENRNPNEIRVDNESVAKPNDADRARFGFGVKKSLTQSCAHLESIAEKGSSSVHDTPSKYDPGTDQSIIRNHAPIDFLKDLDRIMGDPDAFLPVLRMKAVSSKWDLKDRNQEIEEINRSLKEAIRSIGQRRKELQCHFTSTQDEINQRLGAAEEKTREQRSTLDELQNSLTATQQHLKERSDRVTKLEGRLDTAKKEQLSLIDTAKKEQLSLIMRGEESASRASVAEASLCECKAEIESLKKQVADMKELAKAHEKTAAEWAQKAQQQFVESAEQQQALLSVARKKEEDLMAELDRASSRAGELETRAMSAEKDLNDRTQAHDALARQMTLLSDSNAEQDTTIKDLKARVAEKEAKLSELHDSERQLRENVRASERSAEDIRAQLESCTKKATELQLTVQSVEADRDRFAALGNEHQKALQTQQQEHVRLQTKLGTVEGQLVQKEAALTQKEKEIQTLCDKEQALRDELQSSMRETAAVKADLAQCKDANARDVSALKTELTSCKESRDTLEAKLQSAESDRNHFMEEAAGRQRALEASQKDLVASQKDLAHMESSLEAKAKELQSLEEAKVKELQSLEEAKVKELQSLEEAKVKELQSLEAAVADGQKELQTHKLHNIELSTSLEEVKKLLTQSQADMRTAKQEATTLSQENGKLEVEFRCYKEHHGTSNQEQMEVLADLKLTVDKLSRQVESTQLDLTKQEVSAARQQSYSDNLERQLAEAQHRSRELHNVIQELKGNIRVFCRVRPAPDGVQCALESTDEGKLNLCQGVEAHNFTFDKVFAPSAMQEEIFDEVSGLVQSALDGYKVCIFAYGQTGSGKTFTMQGSREPRSWGLIPRSLDKILRTSEQMRSEGWSWSLQASFIEVYNESLRDLLFDGDGGESNAQPVHVIQHHDAWGTMVTNMTSVEVNSMAQIKSLMTKAAKHRAVGSTDMNEVSSRSHSIFALYLKGANTGLGSELHGALHLVDLAGSERLDKSHAAGDRLKETQNINRSLSSLADVFLAKSENRSHVPFRNSKLTHLMEPCLSGQGKTMMLVNVGPEQSNAHETLCSLRFASQVSQCDTGGKPKRACKSINTGNSGNSSSNAANASSSRPQTPAPPPRRQQQTSAVTSGGYAGQRSPPGSAPGSRSPNAGQGAQVRQRTNSRPW